MEREVTMKNMKGERCPYDKRFFCQESYCDGCGVYEHYSSEKYRKWKEIVKEK